MPTLNPETLGTVPSVINKETKPSTYSVYIIIRALYLQSHICELLLVHILNALYLPGSTIWKVVEILRKKPRWRKQVTGGMP